MKRALLTLAACLPLAAPAAIVTVSGQNFDLRYDDAQLSLFGTPTLVGDTLFFTPSAFRAESRNGAGTAEIAASVSLELVAHQGFAFGALAAGAYGDYRLIGAGSRVQVEGALSLDGGPTAALQVDGATPLDMADGLLHDWRAAAQLDAGSATQLMFTLDQVLRAFTDPGGSGIQSAFVEQKFAGLEIAVGTHAVPAPGTLPLVALSAVALALLRRGRGAQAG